MSKNNLVVLDCDDVVLDWHKGFIEYVEANTPHKLNHNHPHDSWDMWDWFYDLPKERFTELVVEFNGYPRVLQPTEMARPALLDLYYAGNELVVLTSFGGCPIQTKFRQDYLKVVFGDIFKEIIVLPLGYCKKDSLKKLNPRVFIEDNKAHAEKAIDLGIRTYLVSTTYNQGCEGAIYVSNLYEASELENKINE